MSSTIEELSQSDGQLEVQYDMANREAERRELARDVEAQHERLHTLRAIVLEELTKQRQRRDAAVAEWAEGECQPRRRERVVVEDAREEEGRLAAQ